MLARPSRSVNEPVRLTHPYNLPMSQPPQPDVSILVRRGHAYARRGEYLRAAEAFTGAIDLDPTDADLYFHRGNSLAAAGRHAEAVASFSEALALRPDYAAAYHNR